MTSLSQTPLDIALIGDYNPAVIAHQAIPQALAQSAAALGIDVRWHWLATTEISHSEDLGSYHAIWCVRSKAGT